MFNFLNKREKNSNCTNTAAISGIHGLHSRPQLGQSHTSIVSLLSLVAAKSLSISLKKRSSNSKSQASPHEEKQADNITGKLTRTKRLSKLTLNVGSPDEPDADADLTQDDGWDLQPTPDEVAKAQQDAYQDEYKSPALESPPLPLTTPKIGRTPSAELTKRASTFRSTTESLPMAELLARLAGIDEELGRYEHGYKRVRDICDSLQGEVFEAEVLDQSGFAAPSDTSTIVRALSAGKALSPASADVCLNSGSFKPDKVAIKKVNKILHRDRIAKFDGMQFCVEENVLKEALILHHLTVDNKSTGNYVVRFVELYETKDDYFLVMEYIAGDCNLLQFVNRAHAHIQNGKLQIAHYLKIVKYIFWQLLVTLYWLHHDMNCCHLDLKLENIMVQNADFVEHNGTVTINPAIGVKLCDFGKAELFEAAADGDEKSTFLCGKAMTSLDPVQCVLPKKYVGQMYDARCSDLWAVGQMLYHACVGRALYLSLDDDDFFSCDIDEGATEAEWLACIARNGFFALQKGQLHQHIQMNKLDAFVDLKIVDLLNTLLVTDDKKACTCTVEEVIKHGWFKSYARQYRRRIAEKTKSQKQRLQLQSQKMQKFPYYRLEKQ